MKGAITFETELRGLPRLICRGNFPRKISAAFIGCGLLDRPLTLAQAREAIRAVFPDYAVILPEQTHGDQVVSPRAGYEEEPCSGDAISIALPIQRQVLACIRTADCVPLLMMADSRIALVHAGWRGLANGIIQKAVAAFNPEERLEVFIGPSACGKCYQVGIEVIDAIGELAVAAERDGSLWLDTAETAKAIVHASRPDASCTLSNICTIEDSRFHSFRRDGANSGRNLNYIAIS